MTDITRQTFGIEIETVGKTIYETATIVGNLFGTNVTYVGGGYNKHTVIDNDNKVWTFMSDASLSGGYHSCEVVSPILSYDEIEKLQSVVRALRQGGCKADASCGIHVHVGTTEVENLGKYFKNLTNIVETHFELLVRSLKIRSGRIRWCQQNPAFQLRINKKSVKTENDVAKLWYNLNDESFLEGAKNQHYHSSRYHLLNLHSYFQNKGVEFRAFNGTMHAGEIKAYVLLCLAINTQAINKSFVSKQNVETGINDAFAMNSWLYNLGLAGDEFKNARKHLIKHLTGNLAYKNGSNTVREVA